MAVCGVGNVAPQLGLSAAARRPEGSLAQAAVHAEYTTVRTIA